MNFRFAWMLLGLLPPLGAAPARDVAAARQPPPARFVRPGPGREAVASAHRLATEAGLAVLWKGGNAFDAAVTVSWCRAPVS